jgi:DNA processing protein
VQKQVSLEIAEIKKRKIQTVSFQDAHYPQLLKEIYGFPPLFSYYGELPNNEHFFVAFVGSRKASNYGVKQTRKIITELANNYKDIVIVSGLAYGIDAVAHRVALDLGVKTIAVLGSGLGVIYPKIHQSLANEIVQKGGAVISEFYTMSQPAPQNFPFRNRIISGLCSASIIMEAASKSGALITAKYALEQNREVFALPGNVDLPSFQGCNQLLKQGANLVTCGADILEHFSLQKIIPTLHKEKKLEAKKWSQEELLILEAIEKQPATLEEIAINTSLSISSVMQMATDLEIKGAIREELGGTYYLTN